MGQFTNLLQGRPHLIERVKAVDFVVTRSVNSAVELALSNMLALNHFVTAMPNLRCVNIAHPFALRTWVVESFRTVEEASGLCFMDAGGITAAHILRLSAMRKLKNLQWLTPPGEPDSRAWAPAFAGLRQLEITAVPRASPDSLWTMLDTMEWVPRFPHTLLI